jgi:hypothetical protein
MLAATIAVAISSPPLDGGPAAAKQATNAVAPTIVTVRPTVRSRPIPPGFVGLSLEYRTVLSYAGTDAAAINPLFVRLLRGLAPGQAPVLRIGGDSTDWTWWPIPKLKRPRGVTYAITPNWLAVARALAQTTRARYVLGINLEADSRQVEIAEARAMLSGIGRRYIAALELGNEPELYSILGWYYTKKGIPVPGRPSSFNIQEFTNEFSGFTKAMSPIPIAGPSTGSFWWLMHLKQFLAAEPRLGMVTVHSYWLNRCLSHRTLAGYPTIGNLLRSAPPSRLALSLKRYTALAHARHIPLRIDEMNSVTCGGQPGVSDVFASALWAVNALFEAMQDGVDGVNIHTFPGTANQIFGFRRVKGQWVAGVRPEYYGLRLFAQAAPPGSRLLRIIQMHTGHTRAWATLGTHGVVRVVLVNESQRYPTSVLVRAQTPGETAQVERLTAPSASATTGITLGGQSFGTQTVTGVAAGRQSVTALPPYPRTGGTIATYRVAVPAASAVMMTISRRGTP